MSEFKIRFIDEAEAEGYMEGIKNYLIHNDPASCGTISNPFTFYNHNNDDGSPEVLTDCDLTKKNLGWDETDAEKITEEGVIKGNGNLVNDVVFPEPHEIPVYRNVKFKVMGDTDFTELNHIKDFKLAGNLITIIENDGVGRVLIPVNSLLILEEY